MRGVFVIGAPSLKGLVSSPSGSWVLFALLGDNQSPVNKESGPVSIRSFNKLAGNHSF